MSIYAGDCEPCARYDSQTRRSKRERKCDACHGPIERGQLYHRDAMLFDGEWQVTERCARCEALYRILSPLMGEDDVCDPNLNCGHTWQDNFREEPPLEVQALAFLTPAESQILLAASEGFEWARWNTHLQGPLETDEAITRRMLRRLMQPVANG